MDTFRTFYVSSVRGNDGNLGTTTKEPFATLDAINSIKLQPGDQVLLECGSVFENQCLKLRDQGNATHPIVIGKYGEGAYPVIHCNGQGIWYQDYGVTLDSPAHVKEGYVSSAILLWDAAYIEISDLEITNAGGSKVEGRFTETLSANGEEDYSSAHKMDRTGVAVVAQNKGTIHNISLRNLLIHDVEGNVYNKHMNNGGIYAAALKPEKEEETGVARFHGLKVENCFLYKISRWGIAIGYTYQHSRFSSCCLEDEWFQKYGHEEVILRNNYVKNVGGDGITPMYVLRPLVEYNTVDSVAAEMNDRIYKEPLDRAGKVAAAIWPWKCKDALLRYNEARDTRFNQDGMAYDADSGDGTIYEFNHSRFNEGGCVMFCLEQAVHNIFRYNVSEEDLSGILSPVDNPDAYIQKNTFYMKRQTPLIRPKTQIGNYQMEENVIIYLDEEV